MREKAISGMMATTRKREEEAITLKSVSGIHVHVAVQTTAELEPLPLPVCA